MVVLHNQMREVTTGQFYSCSDNRVRFGIAKVTPVCIGDSTVVYQGHVPEGEHLGWGFYESPTPGEYRVTSTGTDASSWMSAADARAIVVAEIEFAEMERLAG